MILDDWRPDESMPFHMMLRLLDRYQLQVEIKGTYHQFNSKLIIITTPHDIPTTFVAETAENIAQLTRRVTEIMKFPRDV